MKIYTRTGDDGSTGLYGGDRVSKASVRVSAYGTVDELNATLGWARAAGQPREVDDILSQTQDACFRLGAELASAANADPGVPLVDDDDIASFERAIDELDAKLPPLRSFVLPGGSEGAARLHMARTVCRRAERDVVALGTQHGVRPEAVRWLNRLSDLLFVQARFVNQHEGVADVPWDPKGRHPA